MKKVNKLVGDHKTISLALLLLALVIVFMRPSLFPPGGQALGTHDTGGLFAPWFESIRHAIREGRIPFWDPYQFAGYPFLSNPQTGFFYPPTWLAVVLPANVAISWYAVLHLWLAAVGMLLFARIMGGSWLGATAAAVTYCFSGFFAARLWAGHMGLVATFAWLPWVILAAQWCIRRGDIWSALLAGVPVGLAFLAGHTPSFLYIAAIWLAFLIYDLVFGEQRRLVVVRQAAVMLLMGLGLASVQLLPFAQLSLASQRLSTADYTFATDYSLPPAHLVTLLLPEFFGEPTRIGYWSVPTFEELTYYAGLLALLGTVLALRRPTRLTWFYLLLLVLGLWMALGSYSFLYRMTYDIMPLVRLLRAPARSAVVYVFVAAALLAQGLSTWQAVSLPERSGKMKPLLRGLLVVVALASVAAIAATGAAFMAIHPTETSGRLWHQIGGYAVATSVLMLAIGLIWGLFASSVQRQLWRWLLATVLLFLVVADLWQFGAKLIVLDEIGPSQMWRDARDIIGDSDELVLPWGVSIFDQSGSMEVGLRSAFGYQALEPADLVAFASHVPDPRSSAYDVLGARYVVAPVELSQFTEGEGALELVDHSQGAWVYRRPNALGLARLAYQFEIIEDDELAIQRVHQPGFDPNNTIILDRQPQCDLNGEMPQVSKAMVESAQPGFWQIRTESNGDSLLVLAESNFPGWLASVDGQSVPVYRAFTTIRAVCVPAGEHLVEWEYKPAIFQLGGMITLFSLLLLVVALVMIWRANATTGDRLHPAGRTEADQSP